MGVIEISTGQLLLALVFVFIAQAASLGRNSANVCAAFSYGLCADVCLAVRERLADNRGFSSHGNISRLYHKRAGQGKADTLYSANLYNHAVELFCNRRVCIGACYRQFALVGAPIFSASRRDDYRELDVGTCHCP